MISVDTGNKQTPAFDFLSGGGEMETLIRSIDWS